MNAATRFIQISFVAVLLIFSGVGFAAPTTNLNINSDPPIVQPTGDRFEDDGSEHGMWNQFAYNTAFIFPSPDEEVEDDGTEWD